MSGVNQKIIIIEDYKIFVNNYTFNSGVKINVTDIVNTSWFSYKFNVEIITEDSIEKFIIEMDRIPLDWMLGWLLKTISVNKK